MKITENDLHNLIKNSVIRILKEYNGQYADAYNMLDEKLNELDEINSSLCGDDDVNDLIQQMRQVISSKLGVKTNDDFNDYQRF